MKNIRGLFLVCMFLSSFLVLSLINYQITPLQTRLDDNSNLNSRESTSYSQQWLTNPTMTSPITPEWFSTVGGADPTSVDAMDGQGMANVTVIGDSGVVSVVEPQNGWTTSNWRSAQNPSFPVQPTYLLSTSGAGVSYTWDEGTDQTGNAPSGLYKRQYNIGKDLSDYSITSASLQAEINGSVAADVEAPTEGGGQFDVGDIIRWYILLSDDTGATSYEVAWNQSTWLGDGAQLTMGDSLMTNVSNSILAVFLESILDEDQTSFNITLGVNIICEDNDAFYDTDTFNYLYFTSFNLTFTYAKRLTQTTYAGWSQQGNTLPQGNVVVDAAMLDFQYRLQSGQVWPGTSPNSRIQVQINGVSHPVFIPLTGANSTWQAAGFDVTTLIPKSQNITLSLQVYLADNFDNYQNVTISFDNVYLWINYTVTVTGPALSVSANTTVLYTNQYTQLTVNCENQTAENVSHLIMYNPIASANTTLDTNFNGLRTYLLNYTTATPGPYLFKLYANSSTGITAYDQIYIVWVAPTLPSLTVSANATTLYTGETSQITVTCTNGSERVGELWYLDALSSTNITLATNFTGQQVFLLNKTTVTPGPYVFKFWANSSLGMGIITEKEITIIWNAPQAPTLTVIANITDPFVNYGSQISVTCQEGSGNTSLLWYTSGFDGQNYTLDSNFGGIRIYLLNFTSSNPGGVQFTFYANSTYGPLTSRAITIFWITPQSPVISVSSNTTNPFINQYAQITAQAQSGSVNISHFWYYHAIDNVNYTLATNFAGTRTFYINVTAATSGSRTFRFWANATVGATSTQTISIFWITPQSPILSLDANITNPYINDYSQITLTAQSGSADIDVLWYRNPFTSNNVTLDTNIAGQRIYLLNFTSALAGAYQFRFWANATVGALTSQFITIVWVLPTAPILTVNANTTTPYTNTWTQLTVQAQSGTGNISVVWYYNPLTLNNVTLDSNFAGLRSYLLNFTSATPGAYEFRFWVNSTVGLLVTQGATIVWVQPTPPLLTVNANTTTPYINTASQLTVTCQSGIGNVSVLWYNNPFDSNNYTLDTNFAGVRIFLLNFTTAFAGSRTFRFWANSTFGLMTFTVLSIIWVVPQPPLITIIANTTTPFTNQYVQLTVTGQSGTGNVSVFWYYNPLTLNYVTLNTNFAGTSTHYLNFTSAASGTYKFEFWANSSSGLNAYQFINIVWVAPQPPILTLSSNTTSPFTNDWAQITVQVQSNSGNISVVHYYNPFDLTNYTIDSNFVGQRTYLLNFSRASSGAYQFRFWVNSTFALTVTNAITIIWVTPQAPILALAANATVLETGQWTQITLQAQPGSFNISRLWFFNALTLNNITLDTNFDELRSYLLNFTTVIPGPYQFRFWANSSRNLETFTFVSILWNAPSPPSIIISANITNPYVNRAAQISVQCAQGSGPVDTLWYFNEIDNQTYILDTGITGVQYYNIILTSANPGPFTFQFWANTSSIEITDTILIVWIEPLAPIITAYTLHLTPYITESTNITVQCQSRSGNVTELKYTNPFDGQNYSLDANFVGLVTHYVVHSSNTAGNQTFRFWATWELGPEVHLDVVVFWVSPDPPTLQISVSDFGPEVGQSTRITIVCRSGTGNVSKVWLYNPITGQNVTDLPNSNNFFGERTFYLTLTSQNNGSFTVKVWANSTYPGINATETITIQWELPPEPPIPEWITYVAIGIAAAIAAAVAAWQLYFKVPSTIRDIRGLKKAINAGKVAAEPMKVPPRQGMVDEMFKKKMSMKKLPQAKPAAPGEKVLRKPKI